MLGVGGVVAAVKVVRLGLRAMRVDWGWGCEIVYSRGAGVVMLGVGGLLFMCVVSCVYMCGGGLKATKVV